MKKVFSNSSECLHVFAQQKQDEGRSSNVSFNRNKVYSYSQCIGNIQGENIFLINYNYSVTTGNHNSWLHQAVSHYQRIFVKYPEYPEDETNIKDYENKFNSIVDSLARAKKPEIYFNQLQQLQSSVNSYLEAVKLPKALKNRLVKLTKEDVLSSDLVKKAKDRLQKQAEIAKIKLAESITKFKAFESDYVYNSEHSYLRIKDENIETSKGVTIEKSKVLPFVTIYKSWLVSKSQDLLSHLIGKHLDYYTINQVNEKFVSIGCHKIPVNEILAIS